MYQDFEKFPSDLKVSEIYPLRQHILGQSCKTNLQVNEFFQIFVVKNLLAFPCHKTPRVVNVRQLSPTWSFRSVDLLLFFSIEKEIRLLLLANSQLLKMSVKFSTENPPNVLHIEFL